MDVIPHNLPSVGDTEAAAAADAIGARRLSAGSEVAFFEEGLAQYLGLTGENVVAVSSGSAALYMALRFSNAQERVLALPVYACRALTQAAELAGASYRLVDNVAGRPHADVSREEYATADVALIVDTFGIPAPLPKRNSVTIIADSTHALGASVASKLIGKFGFATVFSLGATKMITTAGHGGIVVSNEAGFIAEIREFIHYDGGARVGFNFAMSDVEAAVGRVQLKRLPELLEKRERIFQRYRAAGIELLDAIEPQSTPVRYRAVMRTTDSARLREGLRRRGITAVVPLDGSLPANASAFPNAAALLRGTLSLPIFPDMTDFQVDRVIEAIFESTLNSPAR
jgi:perosamine synthetase